MELTGRTPKPGQLGSLKCLSAPFPHLSQPVSTRLVTELTALTDTSRLAHERDHSPFSILLEDKLRELVGLTGAVVIILPTSSLKI